MTIRGHLRGQRSKSKIDNYRLMSPWQQVCCQGPGFKFLVLQVTALHFSNTQSKFEVSTSLNTFEKKKKKRQSGSTWWYLTQNVIFRKRRKQENTKEFKNKENT